MLISQRNHCWLLRDQSKSLSHLHQWVICLKLWRVLDFLVYTSQISSHALLTSRGHSRDHISRGISTVLVLITKRLWIFIAVPQRVSWHLEFGNLTAQASQTASKDCKNNCKKTPKHRHGITTNSCHHLLQKENPKAALRTPAIQLMFCSCSFQ